MTDPMRSTPSFPASRNPSPRPTPVADTKQGAEEKLILDDVGIIDSEEAALKCAEVVLEQSRRFLSSTEGWSVVQAPKCDGVKLESKMPSGKKWVFMCEKQCCET